MQHRIFSVSELTGVIKDLLEEKFPFVWITGEISNFSKPVSGHYYFTLKDETAQLNAVMFRNQNRNLKFVPNDGMSVTGLGRISVYAPRGSYQIIFEYLEPKGVGALQVAFEQLKANLAAEGLFDEKYKQPLPFLPHKISIITSPTGAVVHDILNIINRRFPNIHLEIIPVKVQGDGAEQEIASAIELLNVRENSDVAVLARGGGSLEDLYAFNSEKVARAIFMSKIPIVSAVGHETDFTIADFVADLRAPTPSAAAELVVPLKTELVKRCEETSRTLKANLYRYIEYLRNVLKDTSKRLIDPQKKVQDLRLRIDDLTFRLIRMFIKTIRQSRERLEWRIESLNTNNPLMRIKNTHEKLKQKNDNMVNMLKLYLLKKRSMLKDQTGRLDALNPTAVLSRGYSITRTLPGAKVVKDFTSVRIDQKLEVLLAKGTLICRVEGKSDNGEKNF
ncbi:MAG: exodeoxyribonuclease VII large subunit [Desulfobacterales bacterium]|nr:exodeoxyribonuclease VII large subunit [Desulfobacterales bacterium]